MTSYVSHTAVDCANAYELSVWWCGVLGYAEDPDDPNAPGHQECIIISPDGAHKILFIEVPDQKVVKNRLHFDLRPVDGTRDEELARLLAHGATLVNDLRKDGRARLPIKRVMQHIGGVLATRHRVVGRAQIGEKPDLLWDHPELDRLYGRLEAEFELGDRARAIERKLEVIGDAADVLLNLVIDKRSFRLEIAVVALIAFEVVVSLVAFRY